MSGILFRTSDQPGIKLEPSISIASTFQQSNHDYIRTRRDRSTDRSSVMSDEFEPPKKKRVRARLDHLTPSEKLQRRKMKNRIAAQTARDRKRLKIDHLEEENRKLREENEILKSQLRMSTTSSNVEPLSVPMLDDSGVSDNDSIPKTSTCPSMAGSNVEMDLLTVPQNANDKSLSSPRSRSSSTSGAYSNSPEPDEYLDSVVGEEDESKLIDDILKLQDSLFSGPGNDVSLVSAARINAPQQQVQDASFQSLSVENSTGWTSIQLMLLLMIARAHRLFSSRISCCATIHERRGANGARQKLFSNIYDYIQEVKCAEFRRTVDIIISDKHNVRHQKLTALKFLFKYVYHASINHDYPHMKLWNIKHS